MSGMLTNESHYRNVPEGILQIILHIYCSGCWETNYFSLKHKKSNLIDSCGKKKVLHQKKQCESTVKIKIQYAIKNNKKTLYQLKEKVNFGSDAA